MFRVSFRHLIALVFFGVAGVGAPGTAQAPVSAPGLPFELGELLDEPAVVAQCETICKTELSCGTLPSEFRGDCQTLCRSASLGPAVRACMAATNHCAQFSDCAELQESAVPIEAFTAATRCDKTKRESCGSVPGGCGFPQVCCTQILEGGGVSTRINLCGRRHCPWWQLGQGPWCGCPSTKSVYGCS